MRCQAEHVKQAKKKGRRYRHGDGGREDLTHQREGKEALAGQAGKATGE